MELRTDSCVLYQQCGAGRVRCGNDVCISYTQLCDGLDTCGDNTDESTTLCNNCKYLLVLNT